MGIGLIAGPTLVVHHTYVVVWWLHYINTLIQELGSTKTYERTSADEKSIVDNHCCHITTKFTVRISKNQEKLPTLYWLPKLHKRPYESRFIANSIHARLLNCLNC